MQRCDESFYDLVKRDPLFAAEGMDLERAEAAIDALKHEVREFQRAIEPQSFMLRLFLTVCPLTHMAVPFSFLRSFVESERRRRLFLAAPTRTAARNLTRSWQRSARAMNKGARRYERLLRLVLLREPGLAQKTFYDMAGNSFTMEDVARSLKELRQNAHALLHETRARRSFGGTPDVRPERPAPIALSSAPLSEEEQWMEEFEEERLSEWFHITERRGPISYELPHFDGRPTAHQFTLQIGEIRATREPFLSIFLADHFVFLPLGTDANFGRLSTIQFQALIDRGIRYFAQSLTMFYAMREQQYFFDLLTIFDRERRPTLDQPLLNAQRSSLFDFVLWRTVDDLRRYTQMTWLRTRGGQYRTYSLGHAFLMHSHLSIYYLPFNRSVWRLGKPVSFFGSGRAQPHQTPYKPMSEVAPLLTREELRNAMLGGVIRRRVWKEQGVDLYF